MLPSFFMQSLALSFAVIPPQLFADEFQARPLKSTIKNVQPMTGIVLWRTNEDVSTAPIQLEFAYLKYSEVVRDRGVYDWRAVEELLDDIAARGHQAIVRWHDTYVGQPTGVPNYIKGLANYRETNAQSEGQPTGFPDWSHPEWKNFVLEFYTRFAEMYDHDPRLAFVQVGFGLWGEYHIYDGPMRIGETFPSKEFQTTFLRHLASAFQETPWMISVDAAGEHTPFAMNTSVANLRFGLFDDSFNHRRHEKENEPNWKTLGLDRWKHSPTGGEFSFFARKDQTKALAPNGPYGIPFAEQAAKFHISFIIGDDQPKFQSAQAVRSAGMTCGYRFRVNRFVTSSSVTELEIENTGIAPIYYDAFPTIDGIRSKATLKGLCPGETKQFRVLTSTETPTVTIECDRLISGQKIEFEADLP
jgi:hypothetical protein